MIRVSIIGATGYVGMELVRILCMHPNVKIQHLVSSSHAGEAYYTIYPQFRTCALPVMESFDLALAKDTDVFFTALPHGASQGTVAELYHTGKTVIDMSGDFRYDSADVYAKWYAPHQYPQLLKKSVYGLPELHRKKVQHARLIGNPGCYTTCSILALAPLVTEHLIDKNSIIIDAKSGVSGAGRKASVPNLFCEATGDFKAYSVATHRHTSEIEQELSNLHGTKIVLSFTPHLVPMKRGILATSYASLKQEMSAEQLIALYRKYYQNESFVQILSAGSLPQVKHVTGSNNVAIGLTVDKRTNRVIVVSCVDNLIKGAAGQAVQNCNIVCGLPETSGLESPAWYI